MARRQHHTRGYAGAALAVGALTAAALVTAPVRASAVTAACTAGSPESNVSENGFICPVQLPSSAGFGEPSITHDTGTGNNGVDRLYVIAPAGVPTIAGGKTSSPLWTSVDDGLHWSGSSGAPAGTPSAPIYDTYCAGAAGGDSDVVTDPQDNVYTTDLSLANSCMGVSEDHGNTYTLGNPYGSGYQPGDDRPWLAYSDSANEIFGDFDGFDGIHVWNSFPTNTPAGASAGVLTQAETVAVPESVVNQSVVKTVRDCVCPPGGIAVDNSNGAHKGRVYVSFSYQGGTAVAYADPVSGATPPGTCNTTAGASPVTYWCFTVIGDIPTGGSAFQDEWNFTPIKVDSNGTVYVMWAHALNYDATSDDALAGGVQEYYAYSTDGGAHFSNPILLSTEDGTTGSGGTTTFPTLDVVSPGVIDAAWYGTTATGDPNKVPSTAPWNIWYTRVTNAASAPSVAAPEIAISDMHNGCIQTGGGGSTYCSDRSLLDFFQLTDDPGSPHIIYSAGDVTNGVHLYFTKLEAPATSTPETPFAALLLVPAAAAIGVYVRRRRREAAGSTTT